MMMIIINLLILIICIVCIEGLVPRTLSGATNSDSKGSGGERINKQIELSKDKVVTNIELKPNEKIVLCRCWRSTKFPLCDGSHAHHNSINGDNVGPCIVKSITE